MGRGSLRADVLVLLNGFAIFEERLDVVALAVVIIYVTYRQILSIYLRMNMLILTWVIQLLFCFLLNGFGYKLNFLFFRVSLLVGLSILLYD